MEMRIAGKEKGGVDYSSIFLFLLANCALGGGTRPQFEIFFLAEEEENFLREKTSVMSGRIFSKGGSKNFTKLVNL